MTLSELLDEYAYAASQGMDNQHEFREKIDTAIAAIRLSSDYVYIGFDGKPVQARDLEDQLIAARSRVDELEQENEKLLANAKIDAELLMAYSNWCKLNECLPNSSDLIRMMG